ncbi:MAG TPA: DUF2752 domain-containing protein [Ilumatobacteraceae bacterium]
MSSGAVANLRTDLGRRAAPLAGGAAMLAAGAFVAARDPAAPGSPFPTCAFRQATGLWCPGCGLTRGFHELAHGHLGAALSYNVFTPVAAVAIVFAWVGWLRFSWRLPAFDLPARFGRTAAFVVPAVLILYAVLRNIPAAPLRSLAP